MQAIRTDFEALRKRISCNTLNTGATSQQSRLGGLQFQGGGQEREWNGPLLEPASGEGQPGWRRVQNYTSVELIATSAIRNRAGVASPGVLRDGIRRLASTSTEHQRRGRQQLTLPMMDAGARWSGQPAKLRQDFVDTDGHSRWRSQRLKGYLNTMAVKCDGCDSRCDQHNALWQKPGSAVPRVGGVADFIGAMPAGTSMAQALGSPLDMLSLPSVGIIRSWLAMEPSPPPDEHPWHRPHQRPLACDRGGREGE
ncbi:hypothetical protein PCL_07276 [Purpureocillium lilacinum]|uniref:Uncharacterized protein n=1 Tax=Purpureocillium lilacinum TaxID=33203 RepID=A0A2U3DSK2_PURLI|nr:hypothetical protein PCL_07276 [Purpureocillium lilacinum]